MLPRIALACLAVGLASGCGAALVLHREVPRPADIPARAFPVVYVAGSDDELSPAAAESLARHLDGGATRVERVAASQLLARASLERGATLAVLVTVTVFEELRTEMSQPTSRCTPGSACYGYAERFPIDVRVQVGELLVRAFDPHSARELGRAVLRQEERDPSPLAARLAVVERLGAMAQTLVDVRTETVDLELDDPSDAIARDAIDLARRGLVHEARAVLEARSIDATLTTAVRACVLFDVGQLIRIDVDTHAPDALAEESARLAAAEAQILAAIRLAPDERRERALRQLRAERTAREDVRAQEEAADANFGR